MTQERLNFPFWEECDMSEKTGQFRGAAFGGFHRQDVLDYLEKLSIERKEEREVWEAEKASYFECF